MDLEKIMKCKKMR